MHTYYHHNHHNFIALLAFDPTKTKLNQGTAGSEESCKLDSNKNVGHCDSGMNQYTV